MVTAGALVTAVVLLFNPWPQKFLMLHEQPKKKKKERERERGEEEEVRDKGGS